MSVSFGGLGLMSLRNPFTELVAMILGKTDLRSMLCLVVFFIVISVLAYLTNPTETSFRAYLTEQSFRQHLSRLDDNSEDDQKQQQKSHRRNTLATTHALSFDNSSPFHFANRASVSLRTPKHVFHSFGIFTIAAMVPLARSTRTDEQDALMISDSWYIGAFGRWWRGGVIEAWYQDVISRAKDEESWSSGILSMKNLDMLNEYNGLPFSTKSLPPHLLSRGSPPRLRNREKSSQKPAMVPARSSTPPPLPKSASLPLHTVRIPSSASLDRPPSNVSQTSLQAHPHSCLPGDQIRLGSPLLSRSSSTLFDQSPRIAEVLRQISQSKATVLDLRTQLSDCQMCASQSHAALQGEVDSLRERKRQEDASKLEVKSRTKALDDSKRSAESMKKDAEKKLKAAQNARDNATQRMDHLDKEITRLHQRLTADQALIRQSEETVSEAEQEIAEVLENKKREVKVAEDVVAALNQRARELEEKVAEGKGRLALLKESNLSRKTDQSLRPRQVPIQQESFVPWAFPSQNIPFDSRNGPTTPEVERRQPSAGSEGMNGLGRHPSVSRDIQTRRPAKLALGGASNFDSSPKPGYPNDNAPHAAFHTNGHSVFDDSILSTPSPNTSYQHHINFSPFGDMDAPRGLAGVLSPRSQSLIPSGLITSFDNIDGLPRSFQSESDVYMDREWRNNPSFYKPNDNIGLQESGFETMTSSPVSLHAPGSQDFEHDPFEVRFNMTADYGRDQQHHRLVSDNSTDLQRASWYHRTNSDPNRNHFDKANSLIMEKSAPRRWFSSKERPRKGLNPDAKVFSLERTTSPRNVTPGSAFGDTPSGNLITTAYDALNPNGLGSNTIPASTSANNSLLRAFAPSPAEREALQRALGGSTNTSLERLPSLSDVGSIPSSPSHLHAHPANVAHVPQHSAQEMGRVLPSWLQSLPRIRKANFSPWDDEEPLSGGVNNGHVSGAKRHP